jgi:hypothetical protein
LTGKKITNPKAKSDFLTTTHQRFLESKRT